jgi:hypothetical protein
MLWFFCFLSFIFSMATLYNYSLLKRLGMEEPIFLQASLVFLIGCGVCYTIAIGG